MPPPAATYTSTFVYGLLSGLCVALAQPPFNVSFLIWLFAVPLLIVVVRARAIEALTAAYICGLVGMGHASYGILVYSPGIWLLVFLVAPLWSVLPVLLLIGCKQCVRNNYYLVIAPFAWAACQVILTDWFLLPLDISTTLVSVAPLQLVAYVGSAGLTFIIVLNATLIAWAILKYLRAELKLAVAALLSASALVLFSYYAGARLAEHSTDPCVMNIRAAQPAIPMQWGADSAVNPALRKTIHASLDSFLQQSQQSSADVLIWPEGSGALSNYRAGDARSQLIEQAQQFQQQLFISAIDFDEHNRRFNSLFAFGADGSFSKYDKSILVPFSEQATTAGTLPGLFATALGKIGALICFDVLFPDQVRSVVLSKPQFLLVSTSDISFGISNVAQLHLASSVLRAVENRISVVHASNAGPSAIIDPYGRLTAQTQLLDKTELQGCVSAPMPSSVYSRYGYRLRYLFVYACALVVIALLVRSRYGIPHKTSRQRLYVSAASVSLAIICSLLLCTLSATLIGRQIGSSLEQVVQSYRLSPVIWPLARTDIISPQRRAVHALVHIANYYGLAVDAQHVRSQQATIQPYLTWAELEQSAQKLGFNTELFGHDLTALKQAPLPVLVGLGEYRYAVLYELDGDSAHIYEYNFGLGTLKLTEFLHYWDKTSLRLSPPALPGPRTVTR